MRRAITTAAALLLVAASPAAAYSGNDLYAQCSQPLERTWCLGFVSGLISGYIIGLQVSQDVYETGLAKQEELGICPPGASTYGQAVDMVIQYLREHPEERDRRAPILVGAALRLHWSC